MDTEKLLAERLQLFDDTIQGICTNRVPTLSNDFTWRLLDTDLNIKPSEALRDFKKFQQITYEFQKRYQYDCYEMSGMRNNFRLSDSVGGTHSINDETGAIQSLDRTFMQADELGEYAQNPNKILWEKVAPRAFGNATYGQLTEAIKACYDQYAAEDEITETLKTKYGVPAASRCSIFAPIETLFNQYRGIMGLSCDMRRNFSQVKDICDSQKDSYVNAYRQTFSQGHRGSDPISVWDANTTMLAHSIMNNKQFEAFYWDTYKEMLDAAIDQNCTVFQFTEASLMKFKDCFKDIPKGTLSILIEKDDISEMKKLLPNITFIGGMDVNYLGHSSKEECVSEAKRVIDTLYPNFIFSTNKMMSFKGDATRETLSAVQEFVLNYNPNNN